MMEGVSKTPDLILTFFNGQHIIYALFNIEIHFFKRYMNIRLS